MDPLDFAWNYGGNSYVGMPGQAGVQSERIESNFLGMVQGAYKRNGIIFACMRARLGVFSDGRFQYQRLRNGRPGDLFGDQSLSLLETPWPNGTTGDLLTRMLQDADLAGNAFWCVRNGHLRRMRPDWVTIVMGSHDTPSLLPDDLDAELLGYGYFPGGYTSSRTPEFLLPDEVAHFAPTPDPIAHYRGMSWITPVLREIQADVAATVHKLAFFENGATLQTIVSFKDMKQDVFEAFRKKMDLAHKGASNAYKTLYLGGGADATVVGADLKQLDFKVTQGAGETRIAAAAGVHPVIVGLSEGLAGSSLNAGNFGQARRLFSEGTLNTLWRNVSASLQTLVPPPQGAQLVIDKRDIPFLREDAKDAVEIQQNMASTIVSLATGGFTRDSAIAAVVAQDMTLLVEDPNWVSVQLQASAGPTPAGGTPAPATPPAVSPPKARAALAATPDDGQWSYTTPDGEPLDEDSAALLWALADLDEEFSSRSWDPAKHPRNPPGAPGGGRFLSVADRVKAAVKDHLAGKGDGDPLKGFNREQLRKVAKARGIELKRGESQTSIAEKLLGHLSAGHETKAQPRTAKEGADAIHAAPYLRESGGPARNGVDTKNIDSALTYYKGAGYIGINEDLRKGVKNGREQEDIDAIDAGMGPLTSDVVVFRGIHSASKVFGSAWNEQDVTGLEWRDDAFVSTSGDGRSSNAAFSGATGAVMRITVPKGAKAVGVSDSAEMELLLNRGLTFRVVKDDGIVNGRRRLDVEVIT